jgi:GDP-D-mannose dehydratase
MILNVSRFPKEDFVLASGKNTRLSEIIVSVATDLGVSNRISNLDDFLHPKISDSTPIVLADPSKAKMLLGWQAELTPEEILVEIISNKLRENRY